MIFKFKYFKLLTRNIIYIFILRCFSIFIIYFTILLQISCNTNNEYNLNTNKIIKTLTPKYAKGFKIEYYSNYKKIIIYNPWKKNSIYMQYYIFNNDTNLTKNSNYNFYLKKVNSTIVLSTTQIAMLQKLGLQNQIIAIDDTTYIYNKDIINLVKRNKIQLVGSYINLNNEKIIKLNPDIIFASGWDKINSSFDKLINLNYKVAFVLEWQENSLLGRAEWIKYISAFYDKEKIADSLFSISEKKYLDLKKSVENNSNKPVIMQGSYTSDNWYAAGGKSYIANLISDAGGNYILKNDTNTGSIPISFESFFTKAKDADFWFTTSTNNVIFDKRINYFKSVKMDNIFTNTKKTDLKGGNDYWETGITNPDLILQDFIRILHPDLSNKKELIFYKKAKSNK